MLICRGQIRKIPSLAVTVICHFPLVLSPCWGPHIDFFSSRSSHFEQLQTIFTLAAVHWWFITIPIWTYIDMDLNCRHQPQKCQYFSASNHQIFWSTQLCASKIDGFTHRFVPRHEPTTHVYINYWWTIYTIYYNIFFKIIQLYTHCSEPYCHRQDLWYTPLLSLAEYASIVRQTAIVARSIRMFVAGMTFVGLLTPICLLGKTVAESMAISYFCAYYSPVSVH